ncbi:MAG: HD domain-containing protein [Christensenellaceae bacterium]|nr:HD domain-containing protein [Christensenellaceae bacterium]
MNIQNYNALKNYAFECLNNNKFECSHVERVLNYGLILLKYEKQANRDIVIAACLLHDIGKPYAFDMPHSPKGAIMAKDFLNKMGFDSAFVNGVSDCIATHSFRKKNPPESLEAKILFDADKLDMYGSMGIVRTIYYMQNEAIYNIEQGLPIKPQKDNLQSFYSEYYNKIKAIPQRLYTNKAKDIAKKLSKNMEEFMDNLVEETEYNYKKSKSIFDDFIK